MGENVRVVKLKRRKDADGAYEGGSHCYTVTPLGGLVWFGLCGRGAPGIPEDAQEITLAVLPPGAEVVERTVEVTSNFVRWRDDAGNLVVLPYGAHAPGLAALFGSDESGTYTLLAVRLPEPKPEAVKWARPDRRHYYRYVCSACGAQTMDGATDCEDCHAHFTRTEPWPGSK